MSALSGRRVLDLADEKGTYCAKVLADMGADVIKIEPPGGHPSRRVGPFVHDVPHPERSLHFFHYNASKRSITLNLETVDGREIFRKLVKTADILIETFPPGYLDQLGLGYGSLAEIHPAFIMTSITGFGQTGPYRDYKAPDIVGVAMGGQMYISGTADSPPLMPYGSQAYHPTCLYAAVGTLCALYVRNLTGRGQHVDVSMQECVASTVDLVNLFYIYGKKIVTRIGTEHALSAPGKVFKCKDGKDFMVMNLNPQLVEWMKREGMAGDLTDERWLYPFYRRQHREHLNELLEAWALTHTSDELFEGGQAIHLSFGPVSTPEEVLENPQLVARGFFVDVEYPELGMTLRELGAPYKFSESPWRVSRRAPLTGEHNEEVYIGELGLSKEELACLAGAGVI